MEELDVKIFQLNFKFEVSVFLIYNHVLSISLSYLYAHRGWLSIQKKSYCASLCQAINIFSIYLSNYIYIIVIIIFSYFNYIVYNIDSIEKYFSKSLLKEDISIDGGLELVKYFKILWKI